MAGVAIREAPAPEGIREGAGWRGSDVNAKRDRAAGGGRLRAGKGACFGRCARSLSNRAICSDPSLSDWQEALAA